MLASDASVPAAEKDEPNAPAPRASRARTAVRVLLGVVALLLVLYVARQAGGYVPRFAEWVSSLGFWGPLVFMVGYAVATVAFIPGSFLTLAGGAIFGIGAGTLYCFLGATAGATGAFLVARYVARRAIERKLAGNRRFAAIDSAVAKEGRKIVFLLRLSPVFPFVLLNYGLGLSKVRLADYVVASIGMLPGTLLYVYYGKLAGDVASLAAGEASDRGWEYYTVLVLGLVATLVVTGFVTRIARRALAQASGGKVDEGG